MEQSKLEKDSDSTHWGIFLGISSLEGWNSSEPAQQSASSLLIKNTRFLCLSFGSYMG